MASIAAACSRSFSYVAEESFYPTDPKDLNVMVFGAKSFSIRPLELVGGGGGDDFSRLLVQSSGFSNLGPYTLNPEP